MSWEAALAYREAAAKELTDAGRPLSGAAGFYIDSRVGAQGQGQTGQWLQGVSRCTIRAAGSWLRACTRLRVKSQDINTNAALPYITDAPRCILHCRAFAGFAGHRHRKGAFPCNKFVVLIAELRASCMQCRTTLEQAVAACQLGRMQIHVTGRPVAPLCLASCSSS